MFNLNNAKEIIIKPNKDKTYNMTVKYDVYDPEGKEVINEIEITYPKVEIKSFDVDVLATYDEELYSFSIEN
jgi:hypothetical protein